MRLVDFVACDDVRYEVGNKFSLMGIYSDSILLSHPEGQPVRWPVPMRLGFYARLLADPKDLAPNRFKSHVTLDGKDIALIEGELSVQDLSKPLHLALALPGLAIPAPGALSFRIVLKRDDVLVADIVADRPLTIGTVAIRHP